MENEPGKGKVQGEGDYEAARRYRERAERFVAEQDDALPTVPSVSGAAEEAELQQAVDEAREHGKAGDQDWRDAEIMRGKDRGEGVDAMEAEIRDRDHDAGRSQAQDLRRGITQLPPD